MKRFIQLLSLVFLFVFIFSACENENKEDKIKKNLKELQTRAAENIYVTSFSGETNLIVGKRYTYKVNLAGNLPGIIPIRISSDSDKILIAWGDSYYSERVLNFDRVNSFEFSILVIGEENNMSLHVSSDSPSVFLVAGQSERLTSKYPTLTMNAPSAILPNTEFEASSLFPYPETANTALKGIWSFSPFQKVRDGSDGTNSKYSIHLKSPNNIGTYNIKLKFTGESRYVRPFVIGEISQEIKVVNPYSVVYNPFKSSTNHLVFELPYLHLISGGNISWYAGSGLSIVSGQNTSTATFVISNGYQGYCTVQANISHNGTIYNELSEEVWVGKPLLSDNGNYDNLVITERNLEAYIRNPTIEGSNLEINWRILSGNATIRNGSLGILIKSNVPDSQSEIIRISAEVSNRWGTSSKIYEIQVEEIPEFPPNQWIIGPATLSGTDVTYVMTFNATKNYTLNSMYITCLRRGAYDGIYSNKDWDWQYDEWYNTYSPPNIDSQYGDQTCIYDSPSYPKTVRAGEIYKVHVRHYVPWIKKLYDIEYLIFHMYDNLSSPAGRRYVNTRDLVY